MNKKIFSLVVILFVSLPNVCSHALAQERKKVAVLPFNVYSKSAASEIQQDFLDSLSIKLNQAKNLQLIDKRLVTDAIGDKTTDESIAYSVGTQTGANFVITGSITELGDVINVDVRVTDIARKLSLPAIFAQGKRDEGMGQIAARLIGDILVRVGAGQRIVRIEFKGNRRIEGSAINQVLKSGIGNVFSETDLAQDIKAIFKMGYFTDVNAQVSDVPEGTVIVFTVQEKGIITAIALRGNKAVSKDDIEAVLTIKAKQIVNQDKIKADVKRIKDLYDNKGYYDADIQDSLEMAGERDSRVVYTIVENEKLYVQNISFSGNEVYTTKELRKIMSLQEKGFFSFFTDSGILKKDQLMQDIEKINAFYLNNGFIYAQVGEPEITHDKKGINIKIPVTEGRQYQVGEVTIKGDELKIPRQVLLDKLSIRRKKIYDREAVINDIDYLQQACNDEGYAYADVLPRTTPQDKTLTVDINYQIVKGQQIYINRINITGNTKTRDKVIRRLLSVVEGDSYSKSNLKKSYMAINRLKYFDEVDFQTEKGPDETLMDVKIRVKEKSTGMISVGAGYSALDGPMFMTQITQENLFGRGQTLSLKANIGGKSQYYDVSFVEPWLFDIPLWMKIDLWNTSREYDTYSWDSQGGGLTFGYPVWERTTLYAGYRLSNNSIYDVDDNASTYIRDQEGDLLSSSITLTLTRDTTNDNMFPTLGSKNSVSVEYTGGILQGDTDFVKYRISSTWFFPMPLDTVIALRGQGGLVQEMGGTEIPVYERFSLGGINSLRGLRNVGPVDPLTGDLIGGLTMMNFNAEFLFPLIKNAGMKGVIFFDTGNCWISGYHFDDMRKTTGLGVRWYSPIGPLRLEWGYVLDPREDESSSRWEFTIGMFM